MTKTYLVFISIAVLLATSKFDNTIFLPLIIQEVCFDQFAYDEPVPWNLQSINVVKIWDICGSKRGFGITVAIVDSGIDLEHPDLKPNIIGGKSFVQNSIDVDDRYGHGTHLAGIIASVSNNGGVIGIAPQASLMPVKVLDDTGSGSALDIAQGIVWAANHNANIINLSIGSPVSSSLVEDAVKYAYDAGALIIGAAGNCGGEDYQEKGCLSRHQLDYPGVYPTVIAVASINIAHTISTFSSHGTHIELAAPGEEIYSTHIEGTYQTRSGTSFAVAHVAGAAAMIWAENVELSNAELRAALQSTAIDLGASEVDEIFGYGLIDTHAAFSETGSSKMLNANLALNDPQLIRKSLEKQVEFVPGEILVKVKSSALSGASLAKTLGVQAMAISSVDFAQTTAFSNLYLIKVQEGTEETYLQQLSSLADVTYAELNYIYQAQ